MVVLVGEDKLVDVLGKSFALPVEVLPFGARQSANRLEALGCQAELRCVAGDPLVSDNGNHILDCRFVGGIPDPRPLDREIHDIPGVVDSGLFLSMAGRILVSDERGRVRVIP
jgi:ribose 5-phosphate isomerase A